MKLAHSNKVTSGAGCLVAEHCWNPVGIAIVQGVVRLAGPVMPWHRGGMTTASNPYRGFRYPAEEIQHAMWLYHCFSLSLRDVKLILAARGIVVSYETVRD
jgi:hypothetical protein